MTNDLELNNEYKTTDMALAAYLICLGNSLIEYQRSLSGRISFIFYLEYSEKASIESYWQDKALVNPRQYFDNLKMLKNRIYS